MRPLLPEGDSLQRWIAVGVIPALALLLKFWVDRRGQQQTARTEWQGAMETMRDSWKATWESLSQRVERAEAGEADCHKRNVDLEARQNEQTERIDKLQTTVEEVNRILHQHREAETVLQMERDMLSKQVAKLEKKKAGAAPDEDGDPK